ncbi:hypothetical protein ONZ45_g1962 [Pleurotus djamor]|nr:hypothetical protein ONZ45_g1962 [Pleurotus djamor]
MPDSAGVSGILKLVGEPKGISDITPAAGWVILDCDPNVLNQDVRLVCESDHDESGCGHLFDYHGANNKLVRLPESCGHGPFARVVNMALATDQSLPAHASNRIRRRDGSPPQVHILTIDDNLAQVDHSLAGDIKFYFVGVNQPGLDLNQAFVDNIFSDIGNWVSGAAKTVGTAISDAASWVGGKVKDLGDMIKNKTHFEIKPTVETENISLTANVVLSEGAGSLSVTKFCPDNPPKLEAVVDSKGWVQVKAGIIVVGSVLPPNIDQFAAFGGINGQVDAKLHFNVHWEGGFKFDKKIVSDIGLPGFSIPGVITIGPSITLKGKVEGHVELDVLADAHLAYVFDSLELWYPKAQEGLGKHKGIKSQKSNLKLQAAAHIEAKGILRGTISPEVHFGVSVLNGAGSATIYVGADAWLQATVSAALDASANIKGATPPKSAPKAGAKGGKHRRALTLDSSDAPIRRSSYTPPYNRRARQDLVNRDASVGFSGCFWLDLGLKLKAGAEGKMFTWKAEAEFTIWESPSWQLFQKCWAVGKATQAVSKKPTWTLESLAKDAASKACQPANMGQEISEDVPEKKWN